MKRVSLRARLTLLLAMAALVALGIAARVVDWRADAEMQHRFDASLLARAQAFAALVQRGDSGIKVDAAADRVAQFPGAALTDWYVVTCQGNVIAQSNPAPPRIAPGDQPRFANARLPEGRRLRMVALRFRPGAVEDEDPVAARSDRAAPVCELSYALDRGPLDEILLTLDWILVGSILGALVLVLLLTPWLVHRGLRPLTVLDRAMANIGPDAPGGRLPVSGTRELVPLVRRFNEVLARMDAGLARERQFASGLAHEFRTRLAELHTLVDIETRYPSDRDTRTVLGEVGAIGNELEATVAALLQLTRIEAGLESGQRERVALAPLLARILARHQEAIRDRELRLESNAADSDLVLKVDPALLEIVLDNLIGNAITYPPAGSAIKVFVAASNIAIANPAPALEPDDLPRLGQRFWRRHGGAGEQAHAGLGLALASAAAQAMAMQLDFQLQTGVLHARLVFEAPGRGGLDASLPGRPGDPH